MVVCNGEQWPTWQIDTERSDRVFIYLGIPIPTQSLHIYVSGSYGICWSASHLARKRTPLIVPAGVTVVAGKTSTRLY